MDYNNFLKIDVLSLILLKRNLEESFDVDLSTLMTEEEIRLLDNVFNNNPDITGNEETMTVNALHLLLIKAGVREKVDPKLLN